MAVKTADPNDAKNAAAIIEAMFKGEPPKDPVNPPVDPLNPPKDPPDPTADPKNPPADPEEINLLGDDQAIIRDPENHFERLAVDYGIEPDEDQKGDDFKWDYDSLKKGLDKKIDEWQKKLNLDEYDPDSRKVIEYFTDKKGNLVDFYKNPQLAEVEKLKNLSDEELWKRNSIRQYVNMGFTEAEALIKAEADIEAFGDRKTGIFKLFADNAKNNLDKYAEQVIKQMIDEKNNYIEQNNKKIAAKATEERQKMVKELNKMTSFMGIMLNDATKKAIIHNIESGKFLEKLKDNQAQANLNAYLSTVLQQTIVKTYQDKIMKTAEEQRSNQLIEFLKSNFNAAPGMTPPRGSGPGFNQNDANAVNNFLDTVLKK
jgi:hypothetical protein